MNFVEMVLKAGFTIRDMDVIAPHSCSLTQALMRFREIVERNTITDTPNGTLKIRLVYKDNGQIAMLDKVLTLDAIDCSAISLVGFGVEESWKSIKKLVEGSNE